MDIDRWMDLVSEARGIRREISKIAEDYDEHLWKESEDTREAREWSEQKELEDVKPQGDIRSAQNPPAKLRDVRRAQP